MGTRSKTSVIIVGAGIVGAAAAYFLARAGYCVKLIEAEAPAAGATGAADGAVSVASKRPGPMMDAALAGVALYRSLERVGLFAGLFKTRPTLMVAQDDDEIAVLERHGEALARAGADVSIHGAGHARALVPALSDAVRLMVEVKGEGHAIGYEIVARLIEAAGVAVDRRRRALSLELSPDGTAVEAIVTDGGTRRADHFVIAAGGGSATLLGLGYALRPRKGQLAVTERAPALAAALPGSLMSCRYLLSKSAAGETVASGERRFGLVIDPLRTGQLLIGGTREETADRRNDMAAIRRLMAEAVDLLAPVAGLRLLRVFAGVRTATADGRPLIGRMPGLSNLVVATGFEGDGICLGPLAGRIVRQLISGEAVDIDLEPFDPARFRNRSLAA
jgi:glycine/D-amino acid oxidase-like deaminating enzyme